MAQKTKISQRMAMSLLPIIGKTKTKRQVENQLHTIGKAISIITLAVVLQYSLLWTIVLTFVFVIIEHFTVDAFLKAMYGDGKYSDENGDTDPLMQLFKTLKELNDDNLTKKERKCID